MGGGGIRADITVEQGELVGYLVYYPNNSVEPFGSSTNNKVLALANSIDQSNPDEDIGVLIMDYTAYTIEKVVRLDNGNSYPSLSPESAKDNDSGGLIMPIFTEADIGNTIPVEIYIDILEE